LAEALKKTQIQNINDVSLIGHAPATASAANSTLFDLTTVWLAARGVRNYPLGDELFLIHASSGAIHRLNASGKVAWQLLQQEPLSGYALSDVIAAYFNVPLAEVTTDIARLLMALSQADLVIKQQ